MFFDMRGNRHNWFRPGERVVHFALWPGLGDSEKSTPAVSYMHEDAIKYASRLIMTNKLKTKTLFFQLAFASGAFCDFGRPNAEVSETREASRWMYECLS